MIMNAHMILAAPCAKYYLLMQFLQFPLLLQVLNVFPVTILLLGKLTPYSCYLIVIYYHYLNIYAITQVFLLRLVNFAPLNLHL